MDDGVQLPAQDEWRAVANGSGLTAMVVLESPLARFGLCSMMGQVPVMGSTTCPDSVANAVAGLADDEHVDVVIFSHAKPDDGVRRLVETARHRGARVLMLVTGGSEQEQITAAVTLRPDGILLQSELTVPVLEDALQRVVRGELPMPRMIATALLDRVREGPVGEGPANLVFTPRERQALDLLAEGLSNKQIARRLGISVNSAKRHVGNVLAKLNSPNRTLAVARALQAGLVDVPGPRSTDT